MFLACLENSLVNIPKCSLNALNVPHNIPKYSRNIPHTEATAGNIHSIGTGSDKIS
jgi:hypothetical protein